MRRLCLFLSIIILAFLTGSCSVPPTPIGDPYQIVSTRVVASYWEADKGDAVIFEVKNVSDAPIRHWDKTPDLEDEHAFAADFMKDGILAARGFDSTWSTVPDCQYNKNVVTVINPGDTVYVYIYPFAIYDKEGKVDMVATQYSYLRYGDGFDSWKLIYYVPTKSVTP